MPPEPADMRADDGAFDRADRNSYSALCAPITGSDVCRAATSKVEDSFLSTSHWLLTWTALSPWRGCGLVSRWRWRPLQSWRLRPRGSSDVGRLASTAAWQARVEHLGLPRPACAVSPVGADSVRRFAVGGSAVQIRGGSVIFDSLTVCLGRLCRVGTCPVRRPWHPIGVRL